MKSKMLLIISFLLGFGFLQIQCSFKQKDNDMAPVDKLRSKLDRFVKDNIENANIKTEEFYSGFLKLIEEVDVFEDARLKVFTLAFAECKEKLEVAEKLVSERRIAIQLEEQKLSKNKGKIDRLKLFLCGGINKIEEEIYGQVINREERVLGKEESYNRLKMVFDLLKEKINSLNKGNSQPNILPEKSKEYPILLDKILDQKKALESLYAQKNETKADSSEISREEKKLLELLNNMTVFLYSPEINDTFRNRIKTHETYINEVRKLIHDNKKLVVNFEEINEYITQQYTYMGRSKRSFTQLDLQKNSQEIPIEINNNNGNIFEENKNEQVQNDPKIIKQKRIDNFIQNYDLILEGNPEDVKKRREKLAKPGFKFTKEEEKQEAEIHVNYIQNKIGITKNIELGDIVKFYCHKNIDKNYVDNYVYPYINQFILNPNSDTAEGLFGLGGNCAFFLVAEAFLRYYFNPLSKNADVQKKHFLDFIKNKYNDFEQRGLKKAQEKVEDLYVRFSYFINAVEGDCKHAKSTNDTLPIVNKNRQEYILNFSPEKKYKYYENLYESLRDCSISELKKRMEDAGHIIEEGSYLDQVFSICSEFENEFKEDESSLDEKLNFYEQIFQSNNNLFLINVKEFIQSPTEIKLKNLFMLDNVNNNIGSHAEIVLPASAVIAVCFLNYCYNPFFEESIKKQRRVVGLVFDSGKSNFVLRDALRKDFYCLCDSSINDNDHKRVLYMDGDKNSTQSGTIESNMVSKELTGEEVFEKFSASVFNNAPVSAWKKAGLYNLTKHNNVYLSNFLRDKEKNRRTFAQLYKYILKPVVSSGLKNGIKNESFFIKTLNAAVVCASGQELKQLEKLLNKLENSNKFSENIRNKIAHLNHEVEIKRAQEKNKKIIKGRYDIWQQKEKGIEKHCTDLNEQRIDISGYRFVINILNHMGNQEFCKAFRGNYSSLGENDLMFEELDNSTEKIHDETKVVHDVYNSTWWKNRLNAFIYEPFGNWFFHALQEKGVLGAKKIFAAWWTGGAEQEQLGEYIKQVNENSARAFLQLEYDHILSTHQDPDSFYVQNIFKKIGQEIVNPKKDTSLDKILMESKLRNLRGS